MALPDRLIVCYANWQQCDDTVATAALQGCNVIIWFAINILLNHKTGLPEISGPCPNLACVANISHFLKTNNVPTTHLISIGGWNAPHPSKGLQPEVVWEYWKKWNSEKAAHAKFGFAGFDGIDWDLEGNDDPFNPGNTFKQETLDLMGRVSQLAKRDGFVVGMAPAESYFDPRTSLFDRSLLHSYPEWNSIVDFEYHGRNCYAYVFALYGLTEPHPDAAPVPTFDFVAIQLYESYSHANYAIARAGVPVEDYLEEYVTNLTAGWLVDFSSASPAPPQQVRLGLSQLVIGVANGWAGQGDIPKAVYIPPAALKRAWDRLAAAGRAPRGFMFWTIGEEGAVPPGAAEPLFLAAELNRILGVRPAASSSAAAAGRAE